MSRLSLTRRLDRLAGAENRFVLRELVRASIKVSHQNSLLGLVWTLLGPLLTLTVLYLVLNAHFGATIVAYPVYLLLGIVTVGFFTAVTQQMTTFFMQRRQLVQNSTVLTETALFAYLSPPTLKLLVEAALCVGLAAWWGRLTGHGVLLLFPLLVALWALCTGAGLIVGIFCVAVRDVEQIWMVLGRLLFFATPVFYRLDSLPDTTSALIYWLNPLTPVLIGMRAALLTPASLAVGVYGHALLLGGIVLACGYSLYISLEGWLVENA